MVANGSFSKFEMFLKQKFWNEYTQYLKEYTRMKLVEKFTNLCQW